MIYHFGCYVANMLVGGGWVVDGVYQIYTDTWSVLGRLCAWKSCVGSSNLYR